MAKDAKGHGSDGKGGSADSTRRSFQSLYGNTGGSKASRGGGGSLMDALQKSSPALWRETPSSDQGAASALASGPKSASVPVHDSMTSNSTHNDQGHAWGSPEALKDFSNRYNPKGFASGKKEINRAKLSERRQAFLNG